MLQVTDKGIQRLHRLRETVPFMRDKVKAHQVNFDRWESECGTQHCWAGWLTTLPHYQEEGWWLNERDLRPMLYIGEFKGYHALAVYFNLSAIATEKLFGMEHEAGDDFEDRVQFLDGLIATETAQVLNHD